MTDLLDTLRALADPTRLRIVALLRHMELAVGELAAILDQSQPRVSRHIRLLVEAGLIERRKEGSWVFLRLVQSAGVAALRRLADDWPLAVRERAVLALDIDRLDAIRADRAAAASRWFAQHAADWDAIRSLHVPENLVESAMADLLCNRRLGHLLDIGTGTGRVAEIFAGRAARITALDRSPEMLRFARARLSGLPTQVDLVQGDFSALPVSDGSIDTAVLHQVLHFAHDPGQVIGEAARALAPGGNLLIADFAPHDREELRTQQAHARLGFSDAQMRGWFASAGLLAEAVRTLDGDPLTVKLWLARRRSDGDASRRDALAQERGNAARTVEGRAAA